MAERAAPRGCTEDARTRCGWCTIIHPARQVDTVIESIKAWQCIGCGKIEAPRTCVGFGQDRRVGFVHADEHAEMGRELASIRRERDMLYALVRRLVWTRAHAHHCERWYRALQEQARVVLALARSDETKASNAAA